MAVTLDLTREIDKYRQPIVGTAIAAPPHARRATAMSASPSTLSLYRQILRTAARWPSRRRANVIEEIKTEFRENMHETDTGRISEMQLDAQRGLAQLRAQCGLSSDSSDVSYQFEDLRKT